MPLKIVAVMPIYYRERDTVKALDSFKSTVLPPDYRLDVIFAINGANSTLIDYLTSWSSQRIRGIDHAYMFSFPDNHGKGLAVNKSINRVLSYGHTYDMVLSYDSDLVVHDPNWLMNLVDGHQRSQSICKTGAVVSDQIGNCCHAPRVAQHINAKGSELVYAEANEGLAGGCLLTPMHVWQEVGGYLGHRVYGSDDAHYMLDLNKKQYKVCIVKSCSLFHPYPDDVGYQDWKVRACKDQLRDGEREGYYGR